MAHTCARSSGAPWHCCLHTCAECLHSRSSIRRTIGQSESGENGNGTEQSGTVEESAVLVYYVLYFYVPICTSLNDPPIWDETNRDETILRVAFEVPRLCCTRAQFLLRPWGRQLPSIKACCAAQRVAIKELVSTISLSLLVSYIRT